MGFGLVPWQTHPSQPCDRGIRCTLGRVRSAGTSLVWSTTNGDNPSSYRAAARPPTNGHLLLGAAATTFHSTAALSGADSSGRADWRLTSYIVDDEWRRGGWELCPGRVTVTRLHPTSLGYASAAMVQVLRFGSFIGGPAVAWRGHISSSRPRRATISYLDREFFMSAVSVRSVAEFCDRGRWRNSTAAAGNDIIIGNLEGHMDMRGGDGDDFLSGRRWLPTFSSAARATTASITTPASDSGPTTPGHHPRLRGQCGKRRRLPDLRRSRGADRTSVTTRSRVQASRSAVCLSTPMATRLSTTWWLRSTSTGDFCGRHGHLPTSTFPSLSASDFEIIS